MKRNKNYNNLQIVLLFLLPTLIFYTFFLTIPIFDSLRLSFFSGKLLIPDKFVGFYNYIKLFTVSPFNERFFNAFLNTLKLFVILAAFQNIVPFIMAIIVSKKIRFAAFFRVIFFLPSVLPVIVVGFLFKMMLNPVWGVADKILKFFHLDFLIRSWLGDAQLAIVTIALIGGWVYFGVPFVLFLAGIKSMDIGIIEAARIDGASEIGIAKNIIIPNLKPVFGLVTTLSVIGCFTQFDLVYSAANTWGDPAFHTDVFGTLFFRTIFGSNQTGVTSDLGLAAAIATMMFLFVLIGTILVLRFTRKRT